MKIKGTKTIKEEVYIDVNLSELKKNLESQINDLLGDNWIQKDSDNNLSIFYDSGGSHYNESKLRTLTEEEVTYYTSVQNVINFIKKK